MNIFTSQLIASVIACTILTLPITPLYAADTDARASASVKVSKEQLAKKIDGLITQLNDKNNLKLLSVGDQIPALGVEALPLLNKALERDDLSRVAHVAIAKGMELIEMKRDGLVMPKWIQKRLDWYRKNLVDAYKKFGHRDPK